MIKYHYPYKLSFVIGVAIVGLFMLDQWLVNKQKEVFSHDVPFGTDFSQGYRVLGTIGITERFSESGDPLAESGGESDREVRCTRDENAVIRCDFKTPDEYDALNASIDAANRVVRVSEAGAR